MRKLPKKENILITLLLSILVSIVIAPKVVAQEQVRSFTITPPTLTAPLAPGKNTEGTVKVRNETDAAVTFNVLVQDFIVTDTHGTPTILPPDTLSNKYSASSWMGVSPTRFTIPAHGVQELTYFIQVPKDARPGGHYAAFVYAPVTEKGVDSTGATVNSQLGTLFSVVIDGPITENAAVSKFFTPGFQEYGPVVMQTQIKNNGDEHIHPNGSITIKGMFGGKETQPLHENNIFPEAARDYANIMGQKWMFGRYTAVFQGTYGRNGNLPLYATMVFWVIPWKIIIVIILLIVAVILGLMLMKKQQNGDNTPQADSTQETPPAEPTV